MSVLREVGSVRDNAGFWVRHDHTVLLISGRDAAEWLHSQTTNEVVHLASGRGNEQCLLDRRGRVAASFNLYRFEDEFWLLIHQDQRKAFFERMETHLFLEQVNVRDVGAQTPQVAVEGPRALLFLAGLTGLDPEIAAPRFPADRHDYAALELCGHQVLVIAQSTSGEDGFLLLPDESEAEEFLEKLREEARLRSIEEVSPPALEALRIEGGTPVFGKDIDSEVVVSETPLEQSAVSYSKGCYLGQEVVARLKAYGTPKQALIGLRFEADDVFLPAPGTLLMLNGDKVGSIRSGCYSPTLGAHIAFAYLDREHRVPGMRLALYTEAGALRDAVVTPLPFIQPATRPQRARMLYDDALTRFERDALDRDDSAIGLLQEALILDPANEDIYEALGVMLHRHHRVDEAIGYMRRLASLNPDSVMAHTNLSVFYVAKGLIQEAEHEKALAEQLEFKKGLDAKAAAKAAAAERARIRADAEERLGMFAEVLDIDPDDPVATMGMGSALMQLERFAEAVPHLEHATRVKKDYSAAFLKLGQCHEALGESDAAAAAYRAGIEVASRKGDLMPQREMERRIQMLKAGAKT